MPYTTETFVNDTLDINPFVGKATILSPADSVPDGQSDKILIPDQ